MSLWWLMLICGAITFGIRYSFIAVEGHYQPPAWFRKLLPFVPIAALTALVAPELLLVTTLRLPSCAATSTCPMAQTDSASATVRRSSLLNSRLVAPNSEFTRSNHCKGVGRSLSSRKIPA